MDAGIHGHVQEREKALAEGLRELATELRLIDVVEFVTYVRMEKFAHIENLVNSAAEFYFKPGTLMFGASADVHIDWGSAPTVWLDMEFFNKGIKVHFSLVLESCRAAVEIDDMTFDGTGPAGTENTIRLIEAITDARAVTAADGDDKSNRRSNDNVVYAFPAPAERPTREQGWSKSGSLT